MSNALQIRARTTTWYVLAALPALLYFTFLITTAANTPYHDDFYDVFVPLFLYHDSGTIPEALLGLLWQYHQHFVVYDRLVYWLSSLLTRTIHFDALIALGNASLAIFFLQLCRGIKPDNLYILPCASAVLFNLYFNENQYWAMGSLQQLTIMAFTMAVLRLLDNSSSIIAACFFCWLAVFTQSNETLVIPLGFLLLLDNILRGQMKWLDRTVIIWTISSISCLALFYSIQNVTRVDRFFQTLAMYHTDTPITDIVVNFLASLAALPFKDDSLPLHAALPGALHLLLIVFLFLRGWKHDRALCLMLLFCTVSLLAASVARTPHYGPTAFISRYKLFSSAIICIELLLLSKAFHARRFFPLLFALSVLSSAYSYYLYADPVRDYNRYREQKIMEWFYSGIIVTFPLANAILDEAYVKELYNPVRDLPDYPTIPAAIEPVSVCPASVETATHEQLQIVSSPSSRAILIGTNESSQFVDKTDVIFWLCGEKSYRIAMRPTFGKYRDPALRWQELAIVEKMRVASGKYRILLQTGDKIVAAQDTADTGFMPDKHPVDCDQHRETLPEFVPLLYARYCNSRSDP